MPWLQCCCQSRELTRPLPAHAALRFLPRVGQRAGGAAAGGGLTEAGTGGSAGCSAAGVQRTAAARAPAAVRVLRGASLPGDGWRRTRPWVSPHPPSRREALSQQLATSEEAFAAQLAAAQQAAIESSTQHGSQQQAMLQRASEREQQLLQQVAALQAAEAQKHSEVGSLSGQLAAVLESAKRMSANDAKVSAVQRTHGPQCSRALALPLGSRNLQHPPIPPAAHTDYRRWQPSRALLSSCRSRHSS